DKTGTITAGQLTLAHLDPSASISEKELIQIALVASSSSSDPMDQAVRDFAREKQIPQSEILRTFPFTEDRKRETGFFLSDENIFFACVKGAPETLLTISNMPSEERSQW